MTGGRSFFSNSVMLSVFWLLSGLANAATLVDTRIHDVIVPVKNSDSYQIMSTVDGIVYELSPSEEGLLRRIREAASKDQPLHLAVEGRRILSVEPFTSEEAALYSDELQSAASITRVPELDLDQFLDGTSLAASLLGYEATHLSSMDEVTRLFSILKGLRSSSQCYQRAHYWARQMWSYGSVKSMKVFLFFTRKFIREHKYKWWFHVAPYVYMQSQEIVLDPEFISSPQEMHAWTDFFMMDRRFVKPPLAQSPDCQEVARYSEYENNQEARFCYLLKLPMYYYQPIDAEKLDKEGVRVDYWREWDVKHSQKAEGWF